MNTEFELKFLADHDAIRAKLVLLGADCIRKRCLMRRYVFSLQPIDGQERWIRVRDEGEYVTLTLKSFDASKRINSVEELELKISDFDTMTQMLQVMGYDASSYVENYREIWKLHDVLIMLDEWPWLDPFVEIEGKSQEVVFQLVERLEIPHHVLQYGPNRLLYEKKYAISHDDVKKNTVLTFQQKPTWMR